MMIFLAGFAEVLFKALALIGLASAVGGIVLCLWVLRPLNRHDHGMEQCLKTSLIIIACGCGLLVLAHVIILVLESWALADETGRWPLSQFVKTHFARASLIHSCLGLMLCAASIWLLKRPNSRPGWGVMTLMMVLIMVSGAWLVHGVSHLEHAVPLMALTVIHQFGASAWAGGVLHLTFLRRFLRRSFKGMCLWSAVLARFSLLAMCSVGTLLSSALYLSYHYIGNWNGLIGTAYGTMVCTKTALLALALCLGSLNFFSVRRWLQKDDAQGLSRRAPALVESEMFTALIILVVAAALSSQPLAVDAASDRASSEEVLHMFLPKLPQLVPPPHAETLNPPNPSFGSPANHDKVQSNFKHNVCGLLVLIIGICALLDRTGKVRVSRHWPLLFLFLAFFIPLFSERTGIGKEGFWETLVIPEELQCRLSALLVIGLALFEWRARAGHPGHSGWPSVFPLLCLAGSALLLTQSFTAFASKSSFLIEIPHTVIGFLAVIVGVGRLVELRLPKPASRLPGFLWTACVVLIGFVLLFYREA